MTAGKRTRTKALGVLFAGLLSCALSPALLQPETAYADPISELQQIQEQIQQNNADYEAATEQVNKLQEQIDDNENRIAQIEAELPAAQERAANSMRTLYKMQQSSGGLVDLLLASDDFYDLLTTIQYLDVIQEHSTGAVDELVSLESELELTRASLGSQIQEAEEQQSEAESALAGANAARASLEAEIAAQAAAEEAERQAAIEAAEKSKGETFTTESGNQATVEVPEAEEPAPDEGETNNGSNGNGGATSTGGVDWSVDRETFISTWSARIDAYLAGSPLAGQGRTFAEAAWEYGVDPRFSPAISMIESTQGRYCFLPHNAWGWGSSSWGSWEEAIWDHVAGLAIGYGGQLTYAGAHKYCPPNADFWYAGVKANMERI